MLRIAVCDNEREALDKASDIVLRWADEKGIVVDLLQFENGDDLLSQNMVCRMDVVLLDIIMPMLNGMDTARELRKYDSSVTIIFMTSSPEYALESYDVKAGGYLLKPLNEDKLKDSLNDINRRLLEEPKHMVVKSESGYKTLLYRDIEWIEAQNKTIIFFMQNGEQIKTSETLHSFEGKLNDNLGFFKCHRSYIVNILNIDTYNGSEVIMRSGQRIPIARGYGKAFQEAYFNFMFQN